MIVDLLTIALLFAAIIQPTRKRRMVAMVYAFANFAHGQFLSNLEGISYFGSAALVDLAIISITASLPYVPRLTIEIHKICLASISINAIGWVIWGLYLPVSGYNAAMVVLYAWAFIVLLKQEDWGWMRRRLSGG